MNKRRKKIVLSYGLGVDSTSILHRWLTHPQSRDFSLNDLIVISAMTGDEFPDTGRLVTQHILPLLRQHRVRYVQVAKADFYKAEGIKVLSDTDEPDTIYLDGAFKLSQELLRADGELLEIHDYQVDLSEVYTSSCTHKTTADTEVWYR